MGSLALQPGEFMVRAFKGALACSEAAAPNGAATCKVPKLPIKKVGANKEAVVTCRWPSR